MGVKPEIIKNRVRTTRIAYTRHFIAYFLYTHTSLNLKEVARAMGRNDHSTIKNSLKVCKNVFDNDKGYPYNQELSTLVEKLSVTPLVLKKKKQQIQLT
jgi:chromosomal replication initiation ATPase DnaA